eukprot:jgi/Mesvir1/18975/Mv25786-RA.1
MHAYMHAYMNLCVMGGVGWFEAQTEETQLCRLNFPPQDCRTAVVGKRRHQLMHPPP